MKKDKMSKIFGCVLCIGLVIGAIGCLCSRQGRAEEAFSAARFSEQTVIIDAGHGGEDGGAVSVSGVPESGMNLAIALKLDSVFGFYGVRTKLLRTTDASLHNREDVTLRQMKVSDLHNRVAMIEETENAVLISIHQNTFENPAYHGAQVFYAGGAFSRPFAVFTQQLLRATLDPKNNRIATKIPDFVYLMKHITCPAILVECGFLSNPAEDQLLQTEQYQCKIAATLAGAYLNYEPDMQSGEGVLPNEG